MALSFRRLIVTTIHILEIVQQCSKGRGGTTIVITHTLMGYTLQANILRSQMELYGLHGMDFIIH